ncbi:hypothetical protein [Pseudomonas corrugata]|uniref:hypothetical protein n=1 Tax=Pseudomonas corrugata TaxID=47879 RepID=UPI0020C7E469|nr:hypothetical protein [Pseudomonas corrugata]
MPGFQRIQYNNYGGPEVMRVEDFELPAPDNGEVAVGVRFAAINPIDWKLRDGQMEIVTGRAFPARWAWTSPASSRPLVAVSRDSRSVTPYSV